MPQMLRSWHNPHLWRCCSPQVILRDHRPSLGQRRSVCDCANVRDHKVPHLGEHGKKSCKCQSQGVAQSHQSYRESHARQADLFPHPDIFVALASFAKSLGFQSLSEGLANNRDLACPVCPLHVSFVQSSNWGGPPFFKCANFPEESSDLIGFFLILLC